MSIRGVFRLVSGSAYGDLISAFCPTCEMRLLSVVTRMRAALSLVRCGPRYPMPH